MLFRSVMPEGEISHGSAPSGMSLIVSESDAAAPCGGTHCARSAQVGPIWISQVERYKGKLRIHFAAGRRAFAQLAPVFAPGQPIFPRDRPVNWNRRDWTLGVHG